MTFLAQAATQPVGSYPFVVLGIGIATVLGLILVLRVNAFLALIIAAIVVSMMAPGATADKMARVATEFGIASGKIAIVIGLAAIIGECMMASGAADRIVQAFLSLLGEKRASWALMGSGYILAVPVFFDTVFYLLVPLARSLFRRTRKNYLLYILAISAGGAITHTLVPPTPGPLVMAATLNVDVGMMIVIGAIVAIPAAIAGLAVSSLIDRMMPIPFRDDKVVGTEDDDFPQVPQVHPPLWLSLAPVLLPVVLISGKTVIDTIYNNATADGGVASPNLIAAHDYAAIFGDSNFALLLSTLVAIGMYYWMKKPTLEGISQMSEVALMSAGTIILITAAGGAFGAMLKVAQIGDAIKESFELNSRSSGMVFLLMAYGISALMKVAQGSSTVAMITVSAMMAAMLEADVNLGFHPVYLCTSIGAGSLMGSWMNDSGFWIFTKMGRLTESESLRSWTVLLAVLSLTALGMTIVLANVLPLVDAAPTA